MKQNLFTIFLAILAYCKLASANVKDRIPRNGNYMSALKGLCKENGEFAQDISGCVKRLEILAAFTEKGVEGARSRRSIAQHKPCKFCSVISDRTLSAMRRKDKVYPETSHKLRIVCDALLSTKIAKQRCYIVCEVMNDPFKLVADILSPEICFNLPCPANKDKSIPSRVMRANNCKFCGNIVKIAQRDIKFAMTMLNVLYKHIRDVCRQTLKLEYMQSCLESKQVLQEIGDYLIKQFHNPYFCQRIEVC